MIQDIFPHVFHNEYRPDARPSGDSPVLCFDGKKVLVRLQEESTRDLTDARRLFPTAQLIGTEMLTYVFAVDDTEYFLERSGKIFAPEGFAYQDIRNLRTSVSNVCGMISFTGYHLYQWYSDNGYCGSCGAKTVHSPTERALHCKQCGRHIYPRIMPAVIVGVTDGDKLLLTKYTQGFRLYALVAGFTEIGETLEETVYREVLEETGLKVKNIRYYKSQPWGLANDILVGFYCDVDGSNEVRIDETELKLAEWKSRDEIELHPDSFSLTNEMMRMFKEGKI